MNFNRRSQVKNGKQASRADTRTSVFTVLLEAEICFKKRGMSDSSIEEIFTDIYQQKKWGGTAARSGAGSGDEPGLAAYTRMIAEKAVLENFQGLSFVDLGCGDFRVGRRLIPLCSHYVGIDLVRPLVQKNRERYETDTIRFEHMDMSRHELPRGDVCFIRQVFQHLSNDTISSVLPQLTRYKWVFITEHLPENHNLIKPNLDMPSGVGVRVYQYSGVYLNEPPFNLPEESLEVVLEVPGVGLGKKVEPGVIRT
ncbi:MAG: class I SAM-dependent methyltransferase, partial [Verrucomicrobiota bacterium]